MVAMTENEVKVLKMNILGGMNEYILNLGDEDIWETWIALGVPDAATEDDLEFIATDEETWVEVCRLFGRLVSENQK